MGIRVILCAVVVVHLAAALYAQADPATSDSRWMEARALLERGESMAAATLFRELLAEHPRSQASAVYVAIALQKAGSIEEAQASYDVADALNPYGYWAEVGLYSRAVWERDAENAEGSRRYIDLLRARFPDSVSAARIAVVEAELADAAAPTDVLEAELTRVLVAFDRMEQAAQVDDAAHLAVLDRVIAEFPGQGVALRALDTKGHLLIRQERYQEAVAAFQAILDQAEVASPESRVVQTARTRVTALTRKAGQESDMLLQDARSRNVAGDAESARESIRLLRERFPDSVAAARAQVVEAELDGGDVEAARTELMEELAAFRRMDQAKRTADDERLVVLDQVIGDFPGRSVALRALDLKGHVLARNGRRAEAIATFLEVVNRAELGAPRSRLVETAQTRLAGLYHAEGRKVEALEMFDRLADYATDPAVVSNAALQGAGLDFELIQVRASGGRDVDPEEWGFLRDRCEQVQTLEQATPAERARAGLLRVESYCWEGRSLEAVNAAEEFLANREYDEFKQDVATVCFFAGEELQKLGRHAEALLLFQRVLREYRDQKEVWPGMDHMPRTYFRIWESLRAMDAPRARVERAAEALLSAFPESSYAEHVRVVTQQEGR